MRPRSLFSHLRLASLLAAAACLLAACSKASDDGARRYAGPPGTLKVVATVGMVADLVRAVAGQHASVVQLVGSGVDPHLYKPTRNDVKALMDADMVFLVGLHLESKMGEVLEGLSGGKPVVALAEAVPAEALLRDEDGEAHDPHLWMDVGLWSQTVTVIAARLTAARPEAAAEFMANATRLREQLRQLDDYARETLGSIPEGRRVLVTAHDAFNYLGRAYGMEVVGIQGISTESEASVAGINALVDLLVKRGIGAIFAESSVSDKNLRALIAGAASRGHTVRAGGELFSDAMGTPGTYEGTYIGMIDHNVTTITRALGGQAPERGLNGRLAAPTSHAP